MAVLSYKCPGCGGGLIFDPTSQNFKCEYCLTKYTESELDKIAPTSADDKQEEQSHTQTEEQGDFAAYSCPSCGAEVVTDSTTAATFCYYCHNPVVLSGRLSGEFLPQKIIPFTLTKQDAINKFLSWTKKKWFVPKWFFSKKQIETMTGVYFPHWIVDSDAIGSINAEGYTTKTWRTGNTQYTKKTYYQIIRDGGVHLEDVTRPALKKGNKQLVDGIHPFDESKIIDFNMGYLSGFQAEKRDIDRDELEAGVNQEILTHTRSLLVETANEYSGITPSDVNASILSTDWCYVLFPVWTITYKAKNGEVYYFAINGESGKTCGKLPVDYKKLALFMGAIASICFGILLIWGYFR